VTADVVAANERGTSPCSPLPGVTARQGRAVTPSAERRGPGGGYSDNGSLEKDPPLAGTSPAAYRRITRHCSSVGPSRGGPALRSPPWAATLASNCCWLASKLRQGDVAVVGAGDQVLSVE
jgi:hypothetical protein